MNLISNRILNSKRSQIESRIEIELVQFYLSARVPRLTPHQFFELRLGATLLIFLF